METEPKPKRRSHFQAVAHTRYRHITYCGGDGKWVSLSQCTARWRYQLHKDRIDAEVAAGKSCGPDCHNAHKIWRLIDDKEKAEREELRQRLAKQQEAAVDEDTVLMWEQKFGLDD